MDDDDDDVDNEDDDDDNIVDYGDGDCDVDGETDIITAHGFCEREVSFLHYLHGVRGSGSVLKHQSHYGTRSSVWRCV